MKQRDPIADYCHEWVRWAQTRTFYIRPASNGLLARLQPSKTSGVEPNARNHPDMTYFNMAIHTMADMANWRADWAAFKAHYCGEAQPAKVTAYQLEIAERTYWKRIKRFAAGAYSLAHSIKKTHEAMFATTPDERAVCID